jgi:hypothetical protein
MSKDHNPHAAGIYRAIALRHHSRYVEAQNRAEFHSSGPPDDDPPSVREADERYNEAVEEYLIEMPASIEATLALVHFAGVLAADRLVGEITQLPVNDERDAYHQSCALANVAGWLNDRAIEDIVERERRSKPGRCQLRAVESHDDDPAA